METRSRTADLVMISGALAIGAAAFHFCVGFPAVGPQTPDWLFSGPDSSANFIGWHLFRASSWEMPPGSLSAMGYPVGTSVALTDSIPLVAIVLKMFHDVLPATFQYFGVWLLLCFLLQALFGALLIRTVTDNVLLCMLGAALLTLSPAIAHRLNHMALCAHWLLLAALWLNRRHAKVSSPSWRHLTGWGLLVVMAAGTHPYLTVMVLAIAAATILACPVARPMALVRHVASVGALTAVAVGIWWAGGYFVVPDTQNLESAGFGVLSWNALAPLIPPEGALTFGRMPLSTAHYEQHEGFSYAGLGALLIFALALLLLRPRHRPSKPDLALGLACLGLTIFALSPVVTIGSRTVFTYPLEWWGPLTTFRASGRMFWPVLYCLIFASVAIVIRRLPVAVATLVLAAAVALQAADIGGVYRLKRAGYAVQLSDPLASRFWDVVLPRYHHIVLYPTAMCAPPGSGIDYRFFALHGGYSGTTVNGGFAARYDVDGLRQYCQALQLDLQNGSVSDDTIYVVAPGMEALFKTATLEMTCLPVDGFAVCVTRRSHAAWAGEI